VPHYLVINHDKFEAFGKSIPISGCDNSRALPESGQNTIFAGGFRGKACAAPIRRTKKQGDRFALFPLFSAFKSP
jgi:hypothetical protein